MAATLSAPHHVPARTTARSGSVNHRVAERIGLFDMPRSRDARYRLRVLVSAKRFVACFDCPR